MGVKETYYGSKRDLFRRHTSGYRTQTCAAPRIGVKETFHDSKRDPVWE
jgi:hypothetical protein